MDHLEIIKLLLDKGANVNARMKDSTETARFSRTSGWTRTARRLSCAHPSAATSH